MILTNLDLCVLALESTHNIKEMKDCSVITTTYRMGENIGGSIGIIGPTRMNYNQVVSVLNEMVKNIESALKTVPDGKNT